MRFEVRTYDRSDLASSTAKRVNGFFVMIIDVIIADAFPAARSQRAIDDIFPRY